MKAKWVQRMTAMVLAAAMCFALSATSFAAWAVVGGNSKKAETFTVKTKNESVKITFTQNKGVLNYNNLIGNPKTMSAYDSFKIKYQKNDAKACYAPVTVTMEGASYTLKLDKNATYRITVTPADSSTLQIRYGGFLSISRYICGWKNYATWSITESNIKGYAEWFL